MSRLHPFGWDLPPGVSMNDIDPPRRKDDDMAAKECYGCGDFFPADEMVECDGEHYCKDCIDEIVEEEEALDAEDEDENDSGLKTEG